MLNQIAINLIIDICIKDAIRFPDTAHPFWVAVAQIKYPNLTIHMNPNSVTISEGSIS